MTKEFKLSHKEIKEIAFKIIEPFAMKIYVDNVPNQDKINDRICKAVESMIIIALKEREEDVRKAVELLKEKIDKCVFGTSSIGKSSVYEHIYEVFGDLGSEPSLKKKPREEN